MMPNTDISEYECDTIVLPLVAYSHIFGWDQKEFMEKSLRFRAGANFLLSEACPHATQHVAGLFRFLVQKRMEDISLFVPANFCDIM